MSWKPTPVSAKPLAFLDTETTGLDEEKNDIIEIAIVRRDSHGVEHVLHAKVKMERPENAHPRALDVNGYSQEAWANAEDPQTFWKRLVDERWLSDCILAGQNIQFDARFLNATFKRHGIKNRVDYHMYDTCSLALEHLKPWVRSVSLVPLCVALGLEVNNAHTALGDVRMTMAVEKSLARADDETRSNWAVEIPARLAAWEAAGKPNVWPAA